MIGKQFGSWRVVGQAVNQKNKYICICELCNTQYVVCGSMLRAGRSLRCAPCSYKLRLNSQREIGKRYYSWKVIEYVDMHRSLQRYIVECVCGTRKIHPLAEIRSGKSQQCVGCHNRQNAKQNIKHGMWNTKLYKVWSAMKNRCNTPSATMYERYGGRGIKVADRWLKFENFLADMGIPKPGLTIDRINNDGNYEPGNCRWVTHKENCNNRTKTYKPRTRGYKQLTFISL